ncbi:MAG: 23S rRNA (pseudouridine(1915)-N(3))-methyltransferase RlmH [Alphaproteobacteria bacterium]
MHLIIAAAGRMKDAPLRAAWDAYAGRLAWRLDLREVEAKAADGPQRVAEEAALLRRALAPAARVVALDRGGRSLESTALATRLARWRDDAQLPIGFVIGGADGLERELVAEADLVIAFGHQTWPHLLARVMLLEQIYRCQAILAGHPYHR